jgi:subtilase family serine protease
MMQRLVPYHVTIGCPISTLRTSAPKKRAAKWRSAKAFLTSAFLFACFLQGIPGSAAERQTLRGHVPEIVKHLRPIGRLETATPLDIVIGLPLRNPESLAARLREIYDPESKDFCRYVTPGQFMETFGPTEREYQTLVRFARANKLAVVMRHPNRTLLHVRASVADIERVFHVHLSLYQHPTENRTFYAPDVEPSLELNLQVLHITGLDNFEVPRSPLKDVTPLKEPVQPVPNVGSAPGGQYTGRDFRPAYAPGVSLLGKGQAVGLLQFDGYYPNDITAYEANAGLPNVPLQNVFLDGFTGTPSTSGFGNVETSLDIEMVIAMAPGVSKVVIYGVPVSATAMVDALNEMANPTQGEPLPHQLSTSWAIVYNASIYQLFQQMAMQGQSFFAFSGDNGAYTAYTMTAGDTLPFPPGDYTYVTSVGGTVLSTSGPAGQWVSESAWPSGGGGPSPWFSIPPWQQGVSMTVNQGSTTMRDCPDVSMVATNILVFAGNGSQFGVAGTSASTPLWAGFTALINEAAAANGRPPVGFINPAIYAIGRGSSYTSSFHDITTGSNAHAGTGGKYNAVPGYDLATGWGTPNGSGLINAMTWPTLCHAHPQFCDAIYDPFWWLKCPMCGIDILIKLGDDFRQVTVFDSLGKEVGEFQRLRVPVVEKGVTYNYRISLKPKKGIGYVLKAEVAAGKEPTGGFKAVYLVRQRPRRSQAAAPTR